MEINWPPSFKRSGDVWNISAAVTAAFNATTCTATCTAATAVAGRPVAADTSVISTARGQEGVRLGRTAPPAAPASARSQTSPSACDSTCASDSANGSANASDGHYCRYAGRGAGSGCGIGSDSGRCCSGARGGGGISRRGEVIRRWGGVLRGTDKASGGGGHGPGGLIGGVEGWVEDRGRGQGGDVDRDRDGDGCGCGDDLTDD